MMLMHVFFVYSVFRLRFPQAVLAGWLGVVIYVGYVLEMDLLSTAALLQHGFALTARDAIKVEGKGEMRTFLLLPA